MVGGLLVVSYPIIMLYRSFAHIAIVILHILIIIDGVYGYRQLNLCICANYYTTWLENNMCNHKDLNTPDRKTHRINCNDYKMLTMPAGFRIILFETIQVFPIVIGALICANDREGFICVLGAICTYVRCAVRSHLQVWF